MIYRDWETGTSFRQALYAKEIGFNLHDTMMYRKINYIPLTHNRYEQEFEYMFVFSKGKPKTFNPIMVECKTKGSKTNGRTFYQTNSQNTPTEGHKNDAVKEYKQKGNVWEVPTNAGTKGHPAQFPEQLANDHIISWSNEGDLVYDPFMGSGTTAKMAILNIDFIYFQFFLLLHYAGNDRSFHDFVQKERRLKINKCCNENCLDTMARIPDGFIDLTVTSPP